MLLSRCDLYASAVALAGDVGAVRWDFVDPGAPCPFEEILAPFVMEAHRRYRECSGAAYGRLTTGAQGVMQRHLLQMLVSLSVQTLHSEFTDAYREASSKQAVDERTFYQCFIERMYRGGLVALSHRYPALAELLETTCELWIEAGVEFLQRLEDDRQILQDTFGLAGPVTTIQPALSDAHNGRRTVMALTFASGHKLVYKPRNVGLEVCYYHLLSWCNEQGLTPACRVLTVLDCQHYGWMEFVEHEPCQDQEALHHYYQRAGMMLCLVYALGGVNCTHEQIIASSEQPVLVDAGLLLHAYACPDHLNIEEQEYCSDGEERAYSVLNTGFLSNWLSFLNTAQVSDHSTLGSGNTAERAARKIEGHALKYGALKVRQHLNTPSYEGASSRIEAYRDDIVAGFQRCYLLLMEQRETLLRPDSPLQRFRQQQARVIYRPDWTYGAVLPKLLAPESLRAGVDRSALLEEQLGWDLIPVEYHLWEKGNRTRWRPAYVSEQEALLRGDIPFFTAYTDSNTLILDTQGEIANGLHRPGFDLVVERLQSLNHADLARQSHYIERVLSAVSGVGPSRRLVAPEQETEPEAHILQEEALRIAEDLSRQAIDTQDGGVTWLTTRFLLRSQHYQLQPMRYSLFDGICGVVLFLAAAARASGEARYRNLALAAIQTIRRQMQNNGALLSREMGIGGAAGLGSMVYALTRSSHLLREPELLANARMAARFIKAEYIARDRVLDVVGGSAGAMLGLLALYDAEQEQEVLELAVLCAQRLLQARTATQAGCLAWPTLGGRHMTGYAHGIAGIAYALARLYTVTRDAGLLTAAREALLYEDCAFLSAIGNWPDEVGGNASSVMATWCHGAPGIGLARLGGLPVLDSARIRNDIEVALQTTRSQS
ncbi:MAG: type 2 lantipeptide synthetase LanM family protein, partial [Ktedonobacteraceae bacterium]|nr:type 2 lantipeptide synthetase LanM family protein [Ktedonobacteraceae bacterium]